MNDFVQRRFVVVRMAIDRWEVFDTENPSSLGSIAEFVEEEDAQTFADLKENGG